MFAEMFPATQKATRDGCYPMNVPVLSQAKVTIILRTDPCPNCYSGLGRDTVIIPTPTLKGR